MRILITNDDGISSPVLPALARFVSDFAEVLVVAPKVEQSGKSHAIDFTRPIEIKQVNIGDGIRAYSMDSTPADCVRFAVLGLKEHFDLVISGINRGFNLGKDIVYSGTAGAVFEAARLGIRGVAISTDPKTFDDAIERLGLIKNFFEKHDLFSENSLYNVNIPLASSEIRITRQGGIYFTDDFVALGDDMYEQVGGFAGCDSDDDGYDIVSIINGYISITPLTAERTNLDVFKHLRDKCK